MALTNFLNRAQVNNQSAYNYYPVHSFGRLNERNNKIVRDEVIPHLAHELKEAVKQEDSLKIQTYIRALGNLGHPKILSVFEPYLEGQVLVTDFQRLAIVVALDKLTQNYPRLARSVLYKIYQNVGEVHQVRVAAVFQLMRTAPPTAMLQRMAQFTHEDPSQQVQAAVESAIRSAAKLTHPDHYELASNAQAAEDFLNEDRKGQQYSRSYLRDYVDEYLKQGYAQQISYIGSQDEILPQAFFLATQRNIGGLKMNSEVSSPLIMKSLHSSNVYLFQYYVMLNSIDQLFEILDDQYDDSKLQKTPENPKNARKQHQPESQSNKWSTQKIAQILNIQNDEAEQLEGISVTAKIGRAHV